MKGEKNNLACGAVSPALLEIFVKLLLPLWRSLLVRNPPLTKSRWRTHKNNRDSFILTATRCCLEVALFFFKIGQGSPGLLTRGSGLLRLVASLHLFEKQANTCAEPAPLCLHASQPCNCHWPMWSFFSGRSSKSNFKLYTQTKLPALLCWWKKTPRSIKK